MKLKEKFLNSPCEKGYINTNVYRAENNVKIADNYAIEFAEWIGANDYKKYSNGWANFSTKATTAKKLLEIFKKEKQL